MKEFVVNMIDFWQETWHTSRWLFFAEAGGTFFGMLAAAIMGFTAPNPNLWVVFISYEISAAMLMYATYKRKSSWMFCLMLFYFVVTGIGLVRLATGG